MFTNEIKFFRGSGGSLVEVDEGDAEGSNVTAPRQLQHVLGTRAFLFSDPVFDGKIKTEPRMAIQFPLTHPQRDLLFQQQRQELNKS